MKKLTRDQFAELIKKHPEGGIVFVHRESEVPEVYPAMTTPVGAVSIINLDNNETFDWDFDIDCFPETATFTVFTERKDFSDPVERLTAALKILMDSNYTLA